MCYSLYLVHYPVELLLAAGAIRVGFQPTAVSPLVSIPVGIAVSVLVALVFFRVVERHFINSPQVSNRGNRAAHAGDALPMSLSNKGVAKQERDFAHVTA